MIDVPAISPRAARTRAALVAAGFELLAERPIDAIPIDDVVAKASVAKGSFFNHFADKQDFANAIARDVRLELEALVASQNAGTDNPVERIARGMKVAADFACTQPARTVVLIRSQGSSIASNHPLNRGIRHDINAAIALKLLRPEAAGNGVLYWLGLCQAIMADVVDRKPGRDELRHCLAEFLMLGLTGLGVPESSARAIIGKV